jgi:hypothetical protein
LAVQAIFPAVRLGERAVPNDTPGEEVVKGLLVGGGVIAGIALLASLFGGKEG